MLIPTIITFTRIILTPWIVYAIAQNNWPQALVIFIIAASTDLLDGFIARALDQQSTFGQFLDPIADKLLITASLYTASSAVDDFAYIKWSIFALIIKEYILIIGAALLWSYKKFFIRPSRLSRSISVAEMIIVICLCLYGMQLNVMTMLCILISLTLIASIMLLYQYSYKVYTVIWQKN